MRHLIWGSFCEGLLRASDEYRLLQLIKRKLLDEGSQPIWCAIPYKSPVRFSYQASGYGAYRGGMDWVARVW